MLSGFLIGGILLKTLRNHEFGIKELLHFWIRRWFRTLPNYYLFLGINILIFVVLSKVEVPGLAAYSFFLQNLTAPASAFFGESWSLAVEEWFYLLFPLSFYLVNRTLQITKIDYQKSLVFTIALFLIVPLILRLTATPWQESFHFVVLFRLDSIMLGVLMIFIKSQWPKIWVRLYPLLFLGLLLLMSYYGVLPGLQSVPSEGSPLLTSLPALGCALLLPYFDTKIESIRRFGPIITNLSLWSYSIYLCHLPIILTAQRSFGSSINSTELRLLFRLGLLVLIITVAALNYRFYEKPMTDLRERF